MRRKSDHAYPLGQSGPSIQKAGHVPHPTGICATSITTRPVLYDFLLDMRMLGLPFGVTFVLSTPQVTAFVPFEYEPNDVAFEWIRPVASAVAWSTNFTKPILGLASRQ
jgi:hypothetical protein